jgi:N-acetylmuramoyl-L-alanine amidase
MLNENDVKELANVVYHEARGESRLGQLAVAWVIVNRVRTGRWGRSIHNVVWSPRQFSGLKYHSGWKQYEALARSVLGGLEKNPVIGCLFFKHFSLGKGRIRIGNHVFW